MWPLIFIGLAIVGLFCAGSRYHGLELHSEPIHTDRNFWIFVAMFLIGLVGTLYFAAVDIASGLPD